jgi:hypothetical protein
VTDYDPNAPDAATWTNPYQTAKTYTFMDRNLGATEAALSLAGRGLMYQWGRKDPIPGSREGTAGFSVLGKFYGIRQDDAVTASSDTIIVTNRSADLGGIADGIRESIRKPTTYFSADASFAGDWLPARQNDLWNAAGDLKSIYDPCPVGWRVALYVDGTNSDGSEANSPWKGVPAPPTYSTGNSAGVTNWGTNALLPAAGSRYSIVGFPRFVGGSCYSVSASAKGDGCLLVDAFSGNINRNVYSSRGVARPVRCVKE